MSQALYRVSWQAKLSRVEIFKVGLVGLLFCFFFFLSSGIGEFSKPRSEHGLFTVQV